MIRKSRLTKNRAMRRVVASKSNNKKAELLSIAVYTILGDTNIINTFL